LELLQTAIFSTPLFAPPGTLLIYSVSGWPVSWITSVTKMLSTEWCFVALAWAFIYLAI